MNLMEQVRDFSDERISNRCCVCGGEGLQDISVWPMKCSDEFIVRR